MPKKSERTPAEKKAIAQMLEKLANEGKVAPVADPAKAKRRQAQRKRKRAAEGKGRDVKAPCPGTNLRGEPCKAPPLDKGTMIDDYEASGEYCLFHDPNLGDSWKNWKQKQGTTEIARSHSLPRAVDLLANAVNHQPEILFAPHMRALGLEWNADTQTFEPLLRNGKPDRGATHIGFSREGVAKKSRHRDHSLQMKAANDLKDRLFGKPRVSMELGAGIGVGVVTIPHDEDRAQSVAEILAEVGALPSAKSAKKTTKRSNDG